MPKIAIYKSEREAGLAKMIQANASIAYTTRLEDTKLSQQALHNLFKSSGADLTEDQIDLFYLNTILVTTGWNKNDDVFDRLEVWASRYTPIHKQFNLEHDQSKIIGHMTTAKAVNDEFLAIADDTSIDDLPEKFHILTGAVIYRHLSDPEANSEIETIIEEIERSEWYVSMECLFTGFDYAVTAANGEQRVIPRDETTAFLTKHLRAYGGDGKYDDFTVGRCLRNITFSGKGLVRKPANPESIIFNEKVSAFKASIANLGYITSSSYNTKEKTMANENKDTEKDTQVQVLTERLNQLNNELTSARETIKNFESSATTAKITSLESELSAKSEEVTSLKTEISNLTASVSDLTKKVSDAETRASAAEAELKTLNAAKVTVERIALLVGKNAPEDEAKSIVELFQDKDDAAFATIVNIFASKWVAPTQPTNTTASTNNSTPNVVVENKGVVVPDETNRAEASRIAMAKAFEDMFCQPVENTEIGD